jgi:phosphopantetheinyl transferase
MSILQVCLGLSKTEIGADIMTLVPQKFWQPLVHVYFHQIEDDELEGFTIEGS